MNILLWEERHSSNEIINKLYLDIDSNFEYVDEQEIKQIEYKKHYKKTMIKRKEKRKIENTFIKAWNDYIEKDIQGITDYDWLLKWPCLALTPIMISEKFVLCDGCRRVFSVEKSNKSSLCFNCCEAVMREQNLFKNLFNT